MTSPHCPTGSRDCCASPTGSGSSTAAASTSTAARSSGNRGSTSPRHPAARTCATRSPTAPRLRRRTPACFEGMLVSRDIVGQIGRPTRGSSSTWDDAVYALVASRVTTVVYVDHFSLKRQREQRQGSLAIRHLNDASDLFRFHVMRNRGYMAHYLRPLGAYNHPLRPRHAADLPQGAAAARLCRAHPARHPRPLARAGASGAGSAPALGADRHQRCRRTPPRLLTGPRRRRACRVGTLRGPSIARMSPTRAQDGPAAPATPAVPAREPHAPTQRRTPSAPAVSRYDRSGRAPAPRQRCAAPGWWARGPQLPAHRRRSHRADGARRCRDRLHGAAVVDARRSPASTRSPG